jgi:muconolactone delta-isomerase
MQFLVLTLRNTQYTDDDFAPRLAGELQRVRELYADEVVRQIWSRQDRPGAALLVEADSSKELAERMGTFPLVNAGMVDIDAIIPLKPHAALASR